MGEIKKMTKQIALISGATGQDGSYLAELLLEKGYEVHGLYRKSSTGNTVNIRHLMEDARVFGKKFFLHRGDLADSSQRHTSLKPNALEIFTLFNG